MNPPRRRISWAAAGLASLVPLGAAPEGPKVPTYSDHANLMLVKAPGGEDQPVAGVADWEVRRDHVLGGVQAVMGLLPGPERRTPLDLKVVETFEGPGFVRKKVTFAAEPGDRVPAWVFLPTGKTGEVPGMLCLHQTTAIGKDEPAGLGGKPNLHYALELAKRGYAAIVPDYPNFGEYRVDPYAMGYASASMKGVWNHKRAVDVLGSLEGVDSDRLGVIGHSLGGHNAIFVALFEPRLKAVVSSCGFNAFPDYYQGNIAGWSHKGYMPRLKEAYGLDLAKVPFDFPELIGALAPRAFFANAPTHDDNFDVEGVRACLKAAGPVYRLYGAADRLRDDYPDAEHDFPPEVREEAYRFLDNALGREP